MQENWKNYELYASLKSIELVVDIFRCVIEFTAVMEKNVTFRCCFFSLVLLVIFFAINFKVIAVVWWNFITPSFGDLYHKNVCNSTSEMNEYICMHFGASYALIDPRNTDKQQALRLQFYLPRTNECTPNALRSIDFFATIMHAMD